MAIGNYAKPQVSNSPPTPTKAVAGAVEKGIEKDVAAAEGAVEAVATYEEILAEEGISIDEAYAIRDALLVDGYYAEEVKITDNTSVRFRTRSYSDYLRWHRALEAAQPRYAAQRDEITLRYCLAASLERYRDEAFEFPVATGELDAAFDARLTRLLQFPEPVIELLGRKLNLFDSKVRFCLNDGAVESF